MAKLALMALGAALKLWPSQSNLLFSARDAPTQFPSCSIQILSWLYRWRRNHGFLLMGVASMFKIGSPTSRYIKPQAIVYHLVTVATPGGSWHPPWSRATPSQLQLPPFHSASTELLWAPSSASWASKGGCATTWHQPNNDNPWMPGQHNHQKLGKRHPMDGLESHMMTVLWVFRSSATPQWSVLCVQAKVTWRMPSQIKCVKFHFVGPVWVHQVFMVSAGNH